MADINLASSRAICRTCGISDDLAQEIVRTRRRQGAFRSLADLWKVEGMTNTAAGVLSSVYPISIGTRRSPAKKDYPRVSRKDSPSPKIRDQSQSRDRRQRSRSTSRKGRRGEGRLESDNKKEMVSVAVIDVNGQEHCTLAKSVHMEKSPSGNKLYIKCEGIQGYRVTEADPGGETTTPSATTASSSTGPGDRNDVYTERKSNVRGSNANKSLSKSKSPPRDRKFEQIRDDFSKTEYKFWDHIEKSRQEMESSLRHLNSIKGNQTANWVRSLPDNSEVNVQNSWFDPQPAENHPGTSKQPPPKVKRLKTRHHHHQHHRKDKHHHKAKKRRENRVQDIDNADIAVCTIL